MGGHNGADEVHHDTGLQRLLQGAAQLAHELVRPEATACLTLDDQAESLVCRASAGRHAAELASYRLALGEGVAGLAAVRGAVVDAPGGLDPECLGQTRAAAGFEVRDVLGVPLMAGEDVFGMLEALNATHTDGFSTRDAELLGIVAHQVAAAMEMASRLERVRHGFLRTVEYLADLIAAPEATVQCHPGRALPLADAVARRLGLADEAARIVELTHILHDVGSASVGQELPFEPRELTENEREAMREHAAMGALLLQPLAGTWMGGAVAAVKHHHERPDGGGYPAGLRAEQIPIAARIAAVVQAYLAMTEGRPYRAAKPPEEALGELRKVAGAQFDPEVVEALAGCILDRAGGKPTG